jgi:hypothetical protein
MSKKLDALLKNYGSEDVAVIHDTTTVAFVTVDKNLSTEDKLERAFMLTNTIDNAWWNNKNVSKMFDGKTCRSTSIGDMVLVGNEKYVCEDSGWRKL